MVRIPTTSGWLSNQRLGFQPVVGNPPMVGEFPTIYLSWPWCSGESQQEQWRLTRKVATAFLEGHIRWVSFCRAEFGRFFLDYSVLVTKPGEIALFFQLSVVYHMLLVPKTVWLDLWGTGALL